VRVAAVGVIIVDALIWYSLLAFAFSANPVRTTYNRVRRVLDRVMGGLLALFGLRLMLSPR
jgi:threonine efflux protein